MDSFTKGLIAGIVLASIIGIIMTLIKCAKGEKYEATNDDIRDAVSPCEQCKMKEASCGVCMGTMKNCQKHFNECIVAGYHPSVCARATEVKFNQNFDRSEIHQ